MSGKGFVGCFIRGLKEEIAVVLKMFCNRLHGSGTRKDTGGKGGSVTVSATAFSTEIPTQFLDIFNGTKRTTSWETHQWSSDAITAWEGVMLKL